MSHSFQLEPTRADWPQLSGNIYCIGRNYADHAKELGNEIPAEPVVFLKGMSWLPKKGNRPITSMRLITISSRALLLLPIP